MQKSLLFELLPGPRMFQQAAAFETEHRGGVVRKTGATSNACMSSLRCWTCKRRCEILFRAIHLSCLRSELCSSMAGTEGIC